MPQLTPSQDFAGRAGAALVLGASGGLGAAVAGLLLDRGSAVALTYRTPGSPRIEALLARAERGAQVSDHQLDLEDPAASAAAVAAAVARFGDRKSVV